MKKHPQVHHDGVSLQDHLSCPDQDFDDFDPIGHCFCSEYTERTHSLRLCSRAEVPFQKVEVSEQYPEALIHFL